jgi:hypothetical protein
MQSDLSDGGTTGGIILDQSQPFFVQHDGSTGVVYNIRDTEDSRGAVRGLIDTLAVAPSVVVIDFRTASVLCFEKEHLS